MRRLNRAAALTFACLFASSAFAQTYVDFGATNVAAVVQLPFRHASLSPGQRDFAPAVATSLTISTGARLATICASPAILGHATGGTTAPIGTPI